MLALENESEAKRLLMPPSGSKAAEAVRSGLEESGSIDLCSSALYCVQAA
jgi:hypothetical protein